jgi:NAD+-dependent protein deacetylase sirtuin 4
MLSLVSHQGAWIPEASPDWRALSFCLKQAVSGRRVALLTGAGCSTESGIPDYRGEGTARRARNPIQIREFLASHAGRQRYWARSVVGWPRFSACVPNRAHAATAELERAGQLTGVITQNVDRLHQRAGSTRVVELHGALEEVECLSCGRLEHRGALQTRLLERNPGFFGERADMAPDGDAELDAERVAQFRVVGCLNCGGVLKPRVVFFGESVPKERVDAAFAIHDESDALLVVGSSLTVFSGYRFVRRAIEQNKPVFVVNVGETRADPVATLRVPGLAGDVLTLLADGAATNG